MQRAAMESDFCARVTAIWTELVSLLNPFLTFSCCREAAKTLGEEGSLWGVSFLNAVEKTHIYYSGLTGGGSTAMGRGDIGPALLDRDRFGYLSSKDTRETGYLMSFPFELTEEKRLIAANVDHLSANATLRIGLKDENDQPIADYSLEESLPLTVSGLHQ